jgi:superfamily II DNA/RNA helicase
VRSKAGVDIIVATPGRLMDHMRQQNTDLTADRTAGARRGGSHDGHGLLARRPSHHYRAAGRTSDAAFSATMPEEVVHDALEITRQAKYVQVGQRSAPPKSITHRVRSGGSSDKVRGDRSLRRPLKGR